MNHLGKRLTDICLATIALVVLSPFIAITWLAIRLTMGSPAFFRQDRPGYKSRAFALVKFRTMTMTRDAHGHLLSDKDRLTKLGKFLRKYSLDELPQLWNVWVGDMSLVGPRPLLMDYLARYSPEQARRHEVKPGITGWAQINGRNTLTWEERFRLDIWYVDHWSLGLDIEILALTLRRVVKSEGISQAGHATMPEFLGNGRPGL